MAWPIEYLIAVIISSTGAIIAPWLLPRTWRKSIILPIVIPCAVTAVWLLYEQQLNSLARPGDPLIRIDLFLIVPLIALDWLSAAACVVLSQLNGREVT